MAKSIFVLEEGEYSDYHIVGVFSTRENAELVRAALNNEPSIDEWPIDPSVDGLNKGYTPFNVLMLRDGSVEMHRTVELSSYNLRNPYFVWKRSKAPCFEPNTPDCLNMTVLARDEAHAIKIVNEKRARLIAEGGWE